MLRSVVVLYLLAGCAGCNESLFGAHHAHPGDAASPDSPDSQDSPDSGDVPGVCTAPCLADAGAEFDGTAGGHGGHWRYLDDDRSPQRRWQAMSVSGGEMMGSGSNRITSCALHQDSAACAMLPGALLVTSTGVTSAADPAIELKSLTNQVIQLRLRAFVPAGDDQTIRLYRNSREDALFTATAKAGMLVSFELDVDAIPGDRFVAAVAPTDNGAIDVGLQLFVGSVAKAFPSTCQMAFRFDEIAVGNSATDLLCLNGVLTHFKPTGTTTPFSLAPAPFAELGSSAVNAEGTYFHDIAGSQTLDYAQDVTVQLWANLRSFVNSGRAWLFSDLQAAGGGDLGISVVPGAAPMIAVSTHTASGLVEITGPHPPIGSWHFVRVVRTATNLRVCVDGALAAGMDTTPIQRLSTHLPDLGKDLLAPMTDASVDGNFDDLRVISGALPCD
jgi:hypothetical protein